MKGKTKQRLKQGKAQKSAEHDVLGEIHSGDGACVKEAVKCNSCGTGTSVEMAPEGSNKELGLSTDCDVDSSDSVCSQPQMSSSSGHDNSREKSWLSGQASASAPEKEQKHSGASETEKPKMHFIFKQTQTQLCCSYNVCWPSDKSFTGCTG
ncbi:hypothetical protein BaRGS_00035806 [Batillaria attramentaria]|uniref:Uncharacterized protein n=1 Tax=Batillaria attramentaria TaxID=370345 RepID=A0ABD0JDS3_9CAEN